MALTITYFGQTDIGKVRTNNEDGFIAQNLSEDFILVGVVDGMGGEEGGEIATEIFIQSVIGYLSDFHNDTPINLLKRAFAEGNNDIIRHKEVMSKFPKMGCVATLGIFDLKEHTISIAHVGDSRLYRFSNGELSKLTHDHSRIGYQEEQKILSEIAAMSHPMRSVIDKCVGYDYIPYGDESFIESGVFPLIDGEKYLFCSDGLSDVLTSLQIQECLEENLNPKDECELLIKRANLLGGKDNITVVIAYVDEPIVLEDKNSNLSDNIINTDFTNEDNQDNINKNETSNNKLNNKIRSFSLKKFLIYIIFIGIICFVCGFFVGVMISRDLNYNEQIILPLDSDSIQIGEYAHKVVADSTIELSSLESENLEKLIEFSEGNDSI